MTQNNWIKNIDTLIQDIDLNGYKTRYTEKREDDSIISYSKFKLNRNYKTVLITEDNNGWFFECKVYQTKNEVVAVFDFSNLPCYYKGYSAKSRPISEISETKSYFKNDSIGIEYRRYIDVFKNQNIDSLKIELLKKPFNSKLLGKVDYKKEMTKFKRMRKFN